MRIEVLGAFGWTIEGEAVCFHPPSIPYPPADERTPQRYLQVPEDLPKEAAEWAIAEGVAKQVPDLPKAAAPSKPAASEVETAPGAPASSSKPAEVAGKKDGGRHG